MYYFYFICFCSNYFSFFSTIDEWAVVHYRRNGRLIYEVNFMSALVQRLQTLHDIAMDRDALSTLAIRIPVDLLP